MELQYFEFGPMKIVVSIAVVGFCGLLGFLYNELVMKPNTLREILKKQGIDGPRPSFLLGNIRELMKKPQNNNNDKRPIFHNVAAALYPCFGQWKKKYGMVFSTFYLLIFFVLSIFISLIEIEIEQVSCLCFLSETNK